MSIDKVKIFGGQTKRQALKTLSARCSAWSPTGPCPEPEMVWGRAPDREGVRDIVQEGD